MVYLQVKMLALTLRVAGERVRLRERRVPGVIAKAEASRSRDNFCRSASQSLASRGDRSLFLPCLLGPHQLLTNRHINLYDYKRTRIKGTYNPSGGLVR